MSRRLVAIRMGSEKRGQGRQAVCVVLQELGYPFRRQGAPDEVALDLITADRRQGVSLLGRFHSLADDPQAEGMAHGDDRPDDGRIVRIVMRPRTNDLSTLSRSKGNWVR